MAVADVALYVAILGEIGIVPLAVTTSLNINFLRRPSPEKDIIGVCKLMKVGKSLAIGIMGSSLAVTYDDWARATLLYAIARLDADRYRVRQGNYRIIYLIDDGRREITIFKIGHRKDVYR